MRADEFMKSLGLSTVDEKKSTEEKPDTASYKWEPKNPGPDAIRLVILTNRMDTQMDTESGTSPIARTAKRFADVCKERGIAYYSLFVDQAHIEKRGKKSIVRNIEDEEGFEVSNKNTVVLVRGSVTNSLSSYDLLSQLEKAGLFCINSRECVEICADKYRTILKLADAGIPSPKTALLQSESHIDWALKQIGNKFPLVVKTLLGSKGVGVFFLESRRSMTSILQAVWKLKHDADLLLQKYIETDHDLRIHVLGGKVIAAMRRDVIENDYRSNFSQGGKVSKVKLTPEQESLAVLSAKAVSGTWVGVDMVTDSDGVNYVIEVNASPGTEGIEQATKLDIVGMVLDFISNKDNWTSMMTVAGHHEVFDVKGVAKLIGKLDTGNTFLSVIHADDHEIIDGNVVWKLHGKTFKNKLVRIQETLVGAVEATKKKRPVIKLDIEFDGMLLKGWEFALDDRADKSTNLLISRKLLREFRVVVHPGRTYALSNKEDAEVSK